MLREAFTSTTTTSGTSKAMGSMVTDAPREPTLASSKAFPVLLVRRSFSSSRSGSFRVSTSISPSFLLLFDLEEVDSWFELCLLVGVRFFDAVSLPGARFLAEGAAFRTLANAALVRACLEILNTHELLL